MPFVRLILPLGAMFFGAVAVFMGVTALIIALSGDAIKTRHEAADGTVVTTTVDRATDPSGYWMRVGLLGVLPVVAGGAAVLWGRRRLFAK